MPKARVESVPAGTRSGRILMHIPGHIPGSVSLGRILGGFMDWHAVLELVVTVVFLAGIALALLCLVTIHRNPHFSEVQKLKWLLLVLCLPYVGPVTWLLRARMERIDRERAEQERGAQASVATSEEGGW